MPLRQPRKRGVKPAARFQLSPSFVAAVRASGQPIWKLALQAGYPFTTSVSSLLHSRTIAATPLHVERLHRIADAVSFTGSVFVEESEQAGVRA